MGAYLVAIVVAAAICGGIASSIAANKGASAAKWFWLGFFFGPFAILAAAFNPSEQPRLIER
jgi:hypothetical protein